MHSHIFGAKPVLSQIAVNQPCAQIPHFRSIITNGRNQRNCVIEPICHRVLVSETRVPPVQRLSGKREQQKPSDCNLFVFKHSSYEFQLGQYSKQ